MKDAAEQGKLSGSLESGLFFLVVGQNWRSVSTSAEGQQRRTEAVMRMQQETQVEEHRWTEEGNFTKEEAAERGRQNKNEERSKKIEAHPAQWVDLECREKVHEKMLRQMRYLLWHRAQIENGGDGGAVQQRSHGRMEICS